VLPFLLLSYASREMFLLPLLMPVLPILPLPQASCELFLQYRTGIGGREGRDTFPLGNRLRSVVCAASASGTVAERKSVTLFTPVS